MLNKILTKHGYTLIEMALVLTIIAVIAGSSIGALQGKGDAVKRKQTNEKLDVIERALAAHYAIYDRLPCAGEHFLHSSTYGGKEYCEGYPFARDMSTVSPANYASDYGAGSFVVGTVPTESLGLSNDYIYDAWGNYIVYANNLVFTGDYGGSVSTGRPTNPYYGERTNMGTIKIVDATGATRTLRAVYVLFSQGKNGSSYPIWLYNNPYNNSWRGNVAPPDANEAINWNTTRADWGTSNFTYVQQEPTATFDDIVRYKTKSQLVKEAGATLDNKTCLTARTNLAAADYVTGSYYYNIYCRDKPRDPRCTIFINSLADEVVKRCVKQY